MHFLRAAGGGSLLFSWGAYMVKWSGGRRFAGLQGQVSSSSVLRRGFLGCSSAEDPRG